MKRRFLSLFRCLSVLCLLAGGAPGFGQAPIIRSFGQNGELVCGNLQPGTIAVVEWAPSVNGPWTNNWAGLDAVTVPSNGMIRVSVPMYYRVRGAPSNPDPERLVWIPPGTYTMGSPNSEPARDSNEGPQTRVTLSQGFWMGKHEVTQGEYVAVMGSNPSHFRNGTPAESGGTGGAVTNELHHPVEMVSWVDATNYCAVLTLRERNAGRLPAEYAYRLPTEAEWEYACRAGTITPFHYGGELRSGMANFDSPYEYPPCGVSTRYCYNPSDDYLGRTTSVGSYAPNAWGLYDMHGNVWEWCQDWYVGSLSGGSVNDPQGPAAGSDRVYRSGSWFDFASDCRSALRRRGDPVMRNEYVGFRVVLGFVP